MRMDVDLLAADDVKRVLRRPTTVSEARFDWLDDRAAERPEWIAAFMEMKTVWHPIGDVAMAVGTNRQTSSRSGRLDPGAVERRVFVNASPRIVWATLHDPANAGALFPQLRLGPAAPDWPAAASTRRAETRVGLLRDRPASRASRRVRSRALRCG